MSDHVKKQHYVPQFLLNYFTNEDNLIWCYDKQWKKIRQKGVGGVAFEEYFYDKQPGQKDGSLEYVYQQTETIAAAIIQKIVDTRTLSCITLDEKEALAMFIVFQLNRTKIALKEIEDFQGQFWQPIKEFAESTGAKLDSEPGLAKDLWLDSISNTEKYTEIIMKKGWSLAGSGGEFYTSDHPVVKSNFKNRALSGIRGILGLDSDGIEIYFPLTPSLLLCIQCEKSYQVLNENVTQYRPENIEYVNHLQVRQSDKFVFAANRNFALVDDMMKEKK